LFPHIYLKISPYGALEINDYVPFSAQNLQENLTTFALYPFGRITKKVSLEEHNNKKRSKDICL